MAGKKKGKKVEEEEVSEEVQEQVEEEQEQEEEEESESEDEYSDLDEDAAAALVTQEDVIPLSDAKMKELDTIAKKTKTLINRRTGEPGPSENRGVIYLGHIPYGFFEDQMRGFFSQFGEVTRMRLARNIRGKSKHYAFIEFRSAEVAQIVSEAMDNYMMFERILVCHYVEADQVHPDTFKNSERGFRVIPWQKINKEKHNRLRTAREQKKRVKSLLKKEGKRRRQLKECGINYEFSGYKGKVAAVPKRKKFN